MQTVIKAKYDDDNKELIVKCPYCKVERKHKINTFSVKQWFGCYLCDCGEELDIMEIS
jgi:hypothetical protein